MKNPYKILCISESASDEEIKKSYRKLAKEFHPDLSGGDDTKFKEITEAYEILTNPQKRAEWDFYNSNKNSLYDDLFKEFGHTGNMSSWFDAYYTRNSKGSDTVSEIKITFKESYFGCTKDIGIGLKKVSLNIKPGVKNGQRLRLKGYGQKGATEKTSRDLILVVKVIEDSNFLLNNRGLYLMHNVDVFDAILGGTTSVSIFDRKINFTIPKLTQNGAVLRIQNKGFPVYDQPDKFTDLYITIMIQLPQKLNETAENYLLKAKESLDEK
jgi:curved DNA-binding protein